MQRQEHVPTILRALRASVREKDAICCVSTVQYQDPMRNEFKPVITKNERISYATQEHVSTILRALRASVRKRDAICCVSTVQYQDLTRNEFKPVITNIERISYAMPRTCIHHSPDPPHLREKNTLNFQLLPLLVFFIPPLLSVIYF